MKKILTFILMIIMVVTAFSKEVSKPGIGIHAYRQELRT